MLDPISRADVAMAAYAEVAPDEDTMLTDLIADLVHFFGPEDMRRAVEMAGIHYNYETDQEER